MIRYATITIVILIFIVAGLIGCSKNESSNPVGPTVNPPTGLSAAPLSDSSIRLAWTNSETDAAILIQRSPTGSDWIQIAQVAAGTTNHTDAGLTEGSEYHYRLIASLQGNLSDATGAVTAHTLPKAPASLSVTQVTAAAIGIVWADLSATEDAYEVQRSRGDASHYQSAATLAAGSTTYQDTGLVGNTTYYYKVRAKQAALSSTFTAEVSATTLANPSGMTAEAVSDVEIHVQWRDNSSSETGFRVERSTGDANHWATITTVGPNITTHSDTGLDEGTTYYYRSIALTALGESEPSSAALATTLPHAPANLTASDPVDEQLAVVLGWEDRSSVETGYEIQRRTGEFGQFTTITTVAANGTAYTDAGVITATIYYYKVRALQNAAVSAWSDLVSVTTNVMTPSAPTNLTGNAPSDSEATLHWSDNSNNEDGFIVQRSLVASGGWGTIDSVAAGQATYADAGLVSGRNYFYRVCAYNGYGISAYSNVVQITTPPPPPNAPTGLTATANGSTVIKLKWNDASDNEDGFKIERSPDGTTNWAEIARLAVPDTIQYSDRTVVQMTIYYYRVFAYSQYGTSASSNVDSAYTPQSVPNDPTNLLAEAPDYHTVNLYWQDNSIDELGFRLERFNSQHRLWDTLAVLPANQASYTDESLLGKTLYRYRVIAYNAAGPSRHFSNEAQVTTPDSPPKAPDSLLVEQGDGFGHLVVNWLPGSFNEDGYIVERMGPGEQNFSPIGDPVTIPTYDDYGLDEISWYTYRVKSFNEVGMSDYSDSAGAATPSLTLIDQNFDDQNPGDNPNGDWAIGLYGTATTEITDAESHSAGNSFDLYDPDSLSLVWAVLNHPNINQGAYFSCWLKLIPTAQFMLLGTTSGNTLTWEVDFREDGVVYARNGNTWTSVDATGATWDPDTWMHLEVSSDFGTQLFSVTLDDQLIAEDWNMWGNTPQGRIHFITVATLPNLLFQGGVQHAWVDDVFLRVVLNDGRQVMSGGPKSDGNSIKAPDGPVRMIRGH